MNANYDSKLYTDFLSLLPVTKDTSHSTYMRSDGVQVFTLTWRNLLGLDVQVVFNKDTFDFWPVYAHIRTQHVDGYVKLDTLDVPSTLITKAEELFESMPDESNRNLATMNQWLAQYIVTYGK